MVLLSFDTEEFDVPREHGVEIPFERSVAISVEGTTRILDALKRGGVRATFFCTADFAEAANLTPGYFSDLVKRETGVAPKDMIMRQVVAEAKHRLAVSSDDVSTIAYDLGFQYPAHFTRMFNVSPAKAPPNTATTANFQMVRSTIMG